MSPGTEAQVDVREHHEERLCKQNTKWVMNPGAVEAGASQQVKSRWAARQRRGLHMLSEGS